MPAYKCLILNCVSGKLTLSVIVLFHAGSGVGVMDLSRIMFNFIHVQKLQICQCQGGERGIILFAWVGEGGISKEASNSAHPRLTPPHPPLPRLAHMEKKQIRIR